MSAANQSTSILLVAINAKYSHTSFAVRYLLANMAELRPVTCCLEFDLQKPAPSIAAAILAQQPKIVALGTYIWNLPIVTEVVTILRNEKSPPKIILGGPEVGCPEDLPPVASLADYVIAGEADLAFAQLCRDLLNEQTPANKIYRAPHPDLANVVYPYDLYNDQDIAQRLIYVELTRGCPYRCEYCLSSLENGVRSFPLESWLEQMKALIDRGVRYFKFVDRTFNLDINLCLAVLEFFHRHYQPGLQLHLEMTPDRFPAPLKEVILKFPPGALRFEVGIQTFNIEVAKRINRQTDNEAAKKNLRFLIDEAKAIVHADLIVGLPGEDLTSFAAGFDRLAALKPQEIQVGFLKRLRGAPIKRHDAQWGMIYNPEPPYEIEANNSLNREQMAVLKRFARYWEIIVNRQTFPKTTPLLWATGSYFSDFQSLSDRLYSKLQRTHAISLEVMAEQLFKYLTESLGHPRELVTQALSEDYLANGKRRHLPPFLRNNG